MMKQDISELSLKELAVLICEKLDENDIYSVLVGGACVSIYTQNKYQSYDLDFITYDQMKKIYGVLETIGFKQKGRYCVSNKTPYFIDFVAPPIAIGNEPIKTFNELQTQLGTLRLLTPTDCVKDRLASYYHWNDRQGLEQAVLVARSQEIDLNNIKEWSKGEGYSERFENFISLIDDTP